MENVDKFLLELYITFRDVSFVFCLTLAILSFLSAKKNIKEKHESGFFAFSASAMSFMIYFAVNGALLLTVGISIFPNPAFQLISLGLFVCNTVFFWRNV